MKIKILSIFILVLSYSNLHADLLSDFIKINTEYIKDGKTYFSRQELETYKENTKISAISAYSIYSGINQFISIFEKNKEVHFLNTARGYWISNNNLRTPLKVSGSYQVDEIAIQDILKFDFTKDFQVLQQKENEIIIERKNKKISYSYAALSKENDDYILLLKDSKNNNIKKLVYRTGTLNGIQIFTKIFVYNLALNSPEYKCYITKTLQEIKTSGVSFIPENMRNLANYGDKEFYK